MTGIAAGSIAKTLEETMMRSACSGHEDISSLIGVMSTASPSLCRVAAGVEGVSDSSLWERPPVSLDGWRMVSYLVSNPGTTAPSSKNVAREQSSDGQSEAESIPEQ